MEHTLVQTTIRGTLHTRILVCTCMCSIQTQTRVQIHTHSHRQVIGSLFFMANYREVCTVFEVKAIR